MLHIFLDELELDLLSIVKLFTLNDFRNLLIDPHLYLLTKSKSTLGQQIHELNSLLSYYSDDIEKWREDVERTHINFIRGYPEIPINPNRPPQLFGSILECLEHMFNITNDFKATSGGADPMFNSIPYIKQSPCLQLDENLACEEFCKWNDKLVGKQLSKKELLTLMRWAIVIFFLFHGNN